MAFQQRGSDQGRFRALRGLAAVAVATALAAGGALAATPAGAAGLSGGAGAASAAGTGTHASSAAKASSAATASAASGDHAMGSQIRKHEGAGKASSGLSAMASSSSVLGMDVSKWDGTVDWKSKYSDGRRFAWVKATEGTGYKSATFAKQYNGSESAGLIRGAYHFARPDKSSGKAQAKYFSDHGGGWSADGVTLPGALDLEYNPYGADCYGLSKAKMVAWIKSFNSYYKDRWNKYPAIYTSASWWSKCVGKTSFASTNPLWVARYASSPGTLPYNWKTYTVWQYNADSWDKDRFNGSLTQLKALAKNKD